jgi:mannose-6-phosphate isomerase-like protein (cupin superfamily)
MKVNDKNIGGVVIKDNDTYLLEDNNLLNNLTLSKTTLKIGKSTNGHSHENEEEVYFFVNGTATMTIGDENYPAQKGDIFLIPAGKFHRVKNMNSQECEFVCVFQKYDRESKTAVYKKENKTNMKENNYRPLPEGLYIGMSEIEGNGLFTSKELKKDDEMGISHIRYNSDDFHSNYIRTPLGGFINHSETPNCEFYECGAYLKMKISTDINAGEELTVKYTLYDPCKNYVDANE